MVGEYGLKMILFEINIKYMIFVKLITWLRKPVSATELNIIAIKRLLNAYVNVQYVSEFSSFLIIVTLYLIRSLYLISQNVICFTQL